MSFFEIMDDKTGQFFDFGGASAPSEYSAVYNDIVEADRAVDGTLKYEAIATKTKITASWLFMPPATYQKLISMTQLRTFTVRYFEPASGEWRQSEFYMGSDIKADALGQWKGSAFIGYKVSVSFVEV